MKNKLLVLGAVLLLTTAATIIRVKISAYPLTTTLGTNDLFLIAIAGDTNKSIRFSVLKSLINATNVNGSGTANTLAIWSATNKLASLANGSAGYFLGISNGVPTWMAVSGAGGTTNIFDIALFTNNFFISGKGNTLILTQYVQFPWTTLTYSGSNVSAINLTNGSMFKLTLTNDAFIGAPVNLPGTNLAQAIQVHLIQDGTGGRSVMLTNSAWVVSGSGTSSNAIPSITTNANAVTVLTFSSSPFTASKLYGVTSPF
jgi:hypothetical protein